MKRNFFLVSIFSILFVSCNNANKEANIDAKRELLQEPINIEESLEKDINENLKEEIKDNSEDLLEIDIKTKVKDAVKVYPLSGGENFSFNKISSSDLAMGKITITGNAKEQVEKITVQFHNSSSKFGDDMHTLSTYSKTKPEFRYNAFPEYKVFDFGTNEYTFTAYGIKGDILGQSRIIIEYSGDTKNFPVNISGDTKIEEVKFDSEKVKLPISSTYGEANITKEKITYSNIENFSLKSYEGIENFSCENVTDFLLKMKLGYFYWNTCREINSNAYSVYVIEKTSSGYEYYKYYLHKGQGLAGKILLEKGELTTPPAVELAKENEEKTEETKTESQIISEQLKEKNNELKQKNSTYSTAEITDSLVKNL